MACEHGTNEDCLICNVCGECKESVNEDDVCAECLVSEDSNVAYRAGYAYACGYHD